MRHAAKCSLSPERRIFGVMIESFLVSGRQEITERAQMTFGQRIADDVATGAAKVKGAEEANNRDREKVVNREGLGKEIGTLVAARVVTALGGAKAAQ